MHGLCYSPFEVLATESGITPLMVDTEPLGSTEGWKSETYADGNADR